MMKKQNVRIRSPCQGFNTKPGETETFILPGGLVSNKYPSPTIYYISIPAGGEFQIPSVNLYFRILSSFF
jgi:hypothetical protein